MDDIRDVPDLEDEDIDELIEEANLPKLKGKKLKRAIADVKSGKYKVAGNEFCECIFSLYIPPMSRLMPLSLYRMEIATKTNVSRMAGFMNIEERKALQTQRMQRVFGQPTMSEEIVWFGAEDHNELNEASVIDNERTPEPEPEPSVDDAQVIFKDKSGTRRPLTLQSALALTVYTATMCMPLILCINV